MWKHILGRSVSCFLYMKCYFLRQYVAAFSESDALGILTALSVVGDLLWYNIELLLIDVLLWAWRFTYGNKCLFFVVSQGSYGVVKLAYNEDDDKHYVSQSSLVKNWNTVPPHHTCLSAFQQCCWFFFFFFQSHLLKLQLLPLNMHVRLLLSNFKAAGLRSVLSGKGGYKPTYCDEVILLFFTIF